MCCKFHPFHANDCTPEESTLSANVDTRLYPQFCPKLLASWACSSKLRRASGPVAWPSCQSIARKPPALPAATNCVSLSTKMIL